MKHLSKILIVTLFFSLAVALCAFAEEAKAPENIPVVAATSEPVPAPPASPTESVPAAVVASQPVPPPAPVEKTTLDNLQAAFNGENNANARYLAFAQKAEEEGYGKVASLFRAAARAEQVHFEWHAKLIRELGAVPTATIEPTVAKTTAENLEAAMKGEIYENTFMYPEFLAKAKKDGNKGAVDAFEDAERAEGVHAKLYQKALENLKEWKGKGKNFYVCPVCGNVEENMKFRNCPICNTKRSEFLDVK